MVEVGELVVDATGGGGEDGVLYIRRAFSFNRSIVSVSVEVQVEKWNEQRRTSDADPQV